MCCSVPEFSMKATVPNDAVCTSEALSQSLYLDWMISLTPLILRPLHVPPIFWVAALIWHECSWSTVVNVARVWLGEKVKWWIGARMTGLIEWWSSKLLQLKWLKLLLVLIKRCKNTQFWPRPHYLRYSIAQLWREQIRGQAVLFLSLLSKIHWQSSDITKLMILKINKQKAKLLSNYWLNTGLETCRHLNSCLLWFEHMQLISLDLSSNCEDERSYQKCNTQFKKKKMFVFFKKSISVFLTLSSTNMHKQMI